MMKLVQNFKDLIRLNKDYIKKKYQKRKQSIKLDDTFYKNLHKKVVNHPAYFVLSTGRCGTKLLTNILSSCSKLDVHHQPSPELSYPSALAYEEGIEEYKAYCKAIYFSRYELLRDAFIRDKLFVETNCKITFFAPHLREIIPNSRFIHLVRHPFTFIRSAYSRGYYQSYKADRGHIFPRKEEIEEWKSLNTVQKIAWNWLETNSLVENFKKNLNCERCLTIKSEHLFSDINASKKVFKFLGIGDFRDTRIKKRLNRKANKSRKKITLKEIKHNIGSYEENLAGLCSRYGYQL